MEKKFRMWWFPFSLQPVRRCTRYLLSTFFPSSVVFYFLLCRKGWFYDPDYVCRGPNEWQIFRPSLVFTRTPRCFARRSRQSLALDLGHSELDQLHWLHKWLTRLKSLLWSPQCAEGQLPLAESRREAGLRLCTVCLSVFPLSLLSFGGSCCFILRSPETCIKLY